MSDRQQQLEHLRKKIARIDRKYASPKPKIAPGSPPPETNPSRYFIEEWQQGQVVETDYGFHFETERLWERHRRHGSMDISALSELPADLLTTLAESEAKPSEPSNWAFLDTETTGLAGTGGCYAFLIGVGRITKEGFQLKQFFMREQCEEPSLLRGLASYLSQFDTLVTYNGKAYDQPLLENRFRMSRVPPPFANLVHVDLLFAARRLWKLRFQNCRLVELEQQILGVLRDGDLPGEMIPYVYFDYLKTKQAWRVVPILHHNAIDILTLACLTGIVPWAFRSPENAPLTNGAEMAGLGRWLCHVEQPEQALVLFRWAVDKGLPDPLLFRTLWDIAGLEKKLGHDEVAISIYTDLSQCRNEFRIPAYEELAKDSEHRQRNYAKAMEYTRAALEHESSSPLLHRLQRLERRLAKPKKARTSF